MLRNIASGNIYECYILIVMLLLRKELVSGIKIIALKI